MPLALQASQLLSRVIRKNINAGVTGAAVISGGGGGGNTLSPRKINFVNTIQQSKQGNQLFNFLFDAGKRFLGNWLTGLNLLKISVTAIFGWLYSAVESLKAFDWNATDKELQASQQNLNIQLATIWGGLIGNGLGWLAGIAVGYGISLICPVIGGAKLAKLVSSAVALEGLGEFAANLSAAISSTVKLFAGQALIGFYINYRSFIKGLPYDWLVKIYGQDTADFIRQVWGEAGGPNYSFNAFMDEQVSNIKNPVLEAFVEELLEEAWDSFIESGFIIAQELDQAYEQNKLSVSKGTLGTPRTVSVQPDRRIDGEVVVFQALPQNLAAPAIQQAIVTYQALENRDLGQLVGMPVQDYARVSPLELRLKIKLYSVKTPPYTRKQGQKLREVSISIPDLRPGALDWEQVKAACGGPNGYLWGRFRANCRLSNGRIFTVYAASEEEARQRAYALITLSSAEIETINIAEELKVGKRLIYPGLQKDAVRIYPAYMTVINRDRQLAADIGKPTKSGKYRDREERIVLWTDSKPGNFEEVKAEILKKAF